MNPVQQTIAPTATSTNAIALSQTPASAAAMTLNGALVASGTTYAQIGAQQYITIDCAGNDAGRVFTLVGTGRTGQRITFTMAGSNVSQTVSTKTLYTLISITPDAATAGAITVGVVAQGRQYPVVIDRMQNPTTIAVAAVVTGTISYTVQHTFNDPQSGNPDTWTWINIEDTNMVSASATKDSNYAFPPTAIAMLINSGTGSLIFYVNQATTSPG